MPSPKTPSFKDALQQVIVSDTQNLKVDNILDKLPEADRTDVLTALVDTSVSPGRIARALTAMGHDVTDHAIKTWRARPDKRKDRT